MDARRNYPQEPDASDPAARWYQGERGYDEATDWERRSDSRRSDSYVPEAYGSSYADPYRAPEPRSPGYGDLPPVPSAPPAYGDLPPAPASSPPASAPPVSSPLSGPTEALDRTGLSRLGGAAQSPGGSVYQGRRPGLAALLIVLTVVFEVPVLRVFLVSAFASPVNAAGTIAGIFMIAGLPTFALGLYGLIGGAAAAQGGRAWLRTPLAYLPVGLLLFLAAALAG